MLHAGGARCWHARQYRPSSDVMGFRLRGASALSGTMAGPVARSRRSSGRRLASRVRVRSSSPPSGQTARVSRDPMEASVRQRARVAAAHSSGWKGKVSHCVRRASRHSTSRGPGSWPVGLASVLLAGGVEYVGRRGVPGQAIQETGMPRWWISLFSLKSATNRCETQMQRYNTIANAHVESTAAECGSGHHRQLNFETPNNRKPRDLIPRLKT